MEYIREFLKNEDDDNSKMFDLDMNELFEILDKRKEIKNFFD